jgi:class 3 adenylate cyclase
MAEGGGAGGVRSTAIVLFTDLVGSTELRTRLGDEAAEEVRRNHDSLVMGAIEAKRGRLVKNLGDGVMATFSGASDAVAAAVAIQQALDRYNRSVRSAVPLEVRIGISAGDVVVEEGDCFGTPVVEAARLCAAAQGGQILVTEVVRLLAGSGSAHHLTSVGTLDLKGLAAPVSACAVAWEPLPEPSIPMPAVLTRAGRIFVGREEELERLLGLWKEAVAGERGVALLAGEPGIGKTRLAIELAGTVRESGGVVLAGRCDEDMGVPYQPFVEALRHYVTHAPERRLGRYAGELVRLLPDLPQVVGSLAEPLRSDPETERYRLFDALAAWLSDASAEAPIFLVLDDLQWAAKPTLLLLHHVLRSPEALRLLVVATYRDSDIGRGHPLSDFLADLRRHGRAERLSLSGLDTLAVAAFIEAAAGHRLDDDEEQELPRVVWRETEGNPFFVAEVLRHLAESRAIERREGGWVLTTPLEKLGIPEGVRDVVSRRLSRLAESTNRVLSVAAVAGLEFEPTVVGRAAEVGEDELLAALEEATVARLLSEDAGTRYHFAHALVRTTLYEELSGPRRVALHRRVAEAIEALHTKHLDDYLPALAHHWARASVPAGETARAVNYATRAGDRALAQLAHDEAVTYYRQALELLDGAEGPTEVVQRLELLIALGEAQRRAGDPAHRNTLLDAARRAREHGDADALARAALANSRGTLMRAVGTVDTEQVAVLEEALEAIGSEDTTTRARLLATLGLELVWGEQQRRYLLSDEALGVGRRLGDPATLAHVLLTRFFTVAVPATVQERLANTAELLEVCERLRDPVTTCRAYHLRARVAGEVADVEEVERCVVAYERLAEELAQPTLRWVGNWYRTGLVLLSGNLPEGERLALDILDVGRRIGQPDAEAFWALHLFNTRFEQGRLAEFETDFAKFVEEHPLHFFRAMLALLYCETCQEAQARRRFEELASDLTGLPMDVGWIRAVADLAAVCAHLGDVSRAAELSDLLAPYADQLVAAGGVLTGSVSYYLGLLGVTLQRFEEAEARFAAAAATHERIGAPIWLARTRLEWARMLLTRRRPGDAERARDLLGQALATARELGLAKIEREAVELLPSQ